MREENASVIGSGNVCSISNKICDEVNIEESKADFKDASDDVDSDIEMIVKDDSSRLCETGLSINEPSTSNTGEIKSKDDVTTKNVPKRTDQAGKFTCKIVRFFKTVNKISCNICNISYATVSDLEWHCRIHVGELAYKCNQCNKIFENSPLLKYHVCIIPHKCEMCHEYFHNLSSLERHSTIHTGDRPFSCMTCNKSYTSLAVLKAHSKIHSGDKPYKCKICNKSFSNISDRNKHYRIHTDEKTYKCEICNKTFNNPSSCNTHKRIHTDRKSYQCDRCDKTFISLNYFKQHVALHGNEPYGCDMCNKYGKNCDIIKEAIALNKKIQTVNCSKCKRSFSVLTN